MNSALKRARRAAAKSEQLRRWREAEEASPVSRDQFQALLDHVAFQLATRWHDNSFAKVLSWAAIHGIEAEALTSFLEAHRITDDFSLVISGGPFSLFGPTPDRLSWMPLERQQLEILIDYLDESCERNGCDGTVRNTRIWLALNRLPVELTEMALLSHGGGCDCEVVLNVDPDYIYV